MLIGGVDDAGRGAVIGPLVVAGILVDEESLKRIESLGVKDSKALTPRRREYLAVEILNIVKDYHIVKLSLIHI